MSRKSKRGNQKPQIRKSFVLIVDGETESWYVQKLKEQEKNCLRSFSLKPDLRHKKNLEDLCKYIGNLEKEYDKIFWIVDFDTIIKETKETRKGKQRKLDIFRRYRNELLKDNEKIVIIINNPCLEYWLLQHFVQSSKYFSNYEELKKELKKHIPDYDKVEKFYKNCKGGKSIYSFLKPNLEKAILNSENLPEINFNETDIKSYEVGVAEMYKLFKELKIN